MLRGKNTLLFILCFSGLSFAQEQSSCSPSLIETCLPDQQSIQAVDQKLRSCFQNIRDKKIVHSKVPITQKHFQKIMCADTCVCLADHFAKCLLQNSDFEHIQLSRIDISPGGKAKKNHRVYFGQKGQKNYKGFDYHSALRLMDTETGAQWIIDPIMQRYHKKTKPAFIQDKDELYFFPYSFEDWKSQIGSYSKNKVRVVNDLEAIYEASSR